MEFRSVYRSHTHYVEQNKADTENHMLYIFMWNPRTDKPISGDRNLSNSCLWGWNDIRGNINGIKKLATH